MDTSSFYYGFHLVKDSLGFFNNGKEIPVKSSDAFKDTILDVGTYYWRVLNTDPTNPVWSDTMTFTIVSDSIPVPIPFKGEQIIKTRPVLRWSSAKGATYYTVFYSKQKTFASSYNYERSTDTTLRIGQVLTANTMYYWNVRSDAKPSTFSNIDSFFVSQSAQIQMVALPGSMGKISIISKRGALVLSFTDNSFQHLTAVLYDLRGRRLASLQQGIRENMVEWDFGTSSDISTVSSGTYVLYLTINNTRCYSGKVVIP
jgi:hypothetical protein